MIAKAIKGPSFRGALGCDLSKEKGKVIDTNTGGQTPRAPAKDFGEIRKQRPKLGKAILHVSLSAASCWTPGKWRYRSNQELHRLSSAMTDDRHGRGALRDQAMASQIWKVGGTALGQ